MQSDAIADAVPHILADAQPHVLPVPPADDAGPDILAPSADVRLRDRRSMCWRADALTDARAKSGPEPCAFSAAHGRSHSANAVTDARPEPCALRARDGAGRDAPAINDAPIWSSVGAADVATHSAIHWRAGAPTLVGRCHQPVFTITLVRPHHSAEHSALFFADLGAIGGPNPLPDDSIVCQPNAHSVGSCAACDAAAEPATDGRTIAASELGTLGESQHATIAAA